MTNATLDMLYFNSSATHCEKQHYMYRHLEELLSFKDYPESDNLSVLMRRYPCYLITPHQFTNETLIISSSTFDFWCYGILLNLIGLIGILGNSLSLIILSRPQMRSSINYLLIALARCDIILIITSMFLFGFHSIFPFLGGMFWFRYSHNVYSRILKYLFTLAVIAQTTNCYLTLLVSLERYVAVCHPLRAVSKHQPTPTR